MDCVGPIVDILNCVGPPIFKFLKYLMNVDENMKVLRRKSDELNCQKEDIELRLNVECQPGKITLKEVENWMQNAQRINNEIKEIEQKVSKRKYLSCASLGKQIEEKIQEVKEFHQEGSSFNNLVVDAPTRGKTFPTTTLVGESTAKKNLNEIWNFLMSDEVRKIGVCGMGGVGKTTIMQHVNNKLLKETDKFNDVIWVTVSQELDIAKLQNDIVIALNFDLSKEKDATKRAGILSGMLERRKKYVLVLDDMWQAFPLEKVGIPEPSRDSGCKLVITTRSIEVCRFMGCEVVHVKPLPKDEALNLFLDNVGRGVLQIPTLEETVNLIVEQCAGLPLAIVTIANSMKGVDDVREWRNALNELCEHVKSIKGMETEVFERLRFSYDRLKDQKVQYCFLYCALYPEDFTIPRKELIEYWIDEGLIDEMGTRLAMYDRGHAILNRLENNCLLERVVVELGENMYEYVKMHDLVRDMALRITSVSPRFMIKAGIQLQELPPENEWRDVEKVSLMRNYITEIPPEISLECQTLSTLLVKENPLKMIPESFFPKMVRLEILDISYTDIEFLPNSIFDLKHLTALLLKGCARLRHIPDLISKLQALKKLVLRDTSITVVPQGTEKLINLRYLDLCTKTLREMPVGLLPKLSRLQHLTFFTILNNVKVEGEEVAQLRKLETFEGQLIDVHDLNMYVKCLRGQKQLNLYRLHVGLSTWGPMYSKFVGLNGISLCGDSLVLPTNVQQLNIIKCHDVRSLSDISSLKDVTDLRSCRIWNCEGIECVFSLSSAFSNCTTPLHSLEEIWLRELENLCVLIMSAETIVVSASPPPSTPSGTFFHLRIIYIQDCPKIKKLFWPRLLRDLQNLEKIDVQFCQQMEEIIADNEEDENHKEEGSDSSITFTLPKFKTLNLWRLPQLHSICSRRRVMVCDSLQQVMIGYCPKLKRMPVALPLLDNDQPSHPPSLKKIEVYPKEWWEYLEWDHPNAKNVLLPFLKVK